MPAWEQLLVQQQSSDSIVKRSWHFAHCQVTVLTSSSHNRPNLFLLLLTNPEINRYVSYVRDPALPCSPNQSDFSWLMVKKKGDIFQAWGASHFSLTDCNLQCCPHSSDRRTVSPGPEYGTPKQWPLRPTMGSSQSHWEPQQNPVRAMETHCNPLEDLVETKEHSFTLHVNYTSVPTPFVLKSICLRENSFVQYTCWVPTNSIRCWTAAEHIVKPRELQTLNYSSQNCSTYVFLSCQDLERGHVHFLPEFGKYTCSNNAILSHSQWGWRKAQSSGGADELSRFYLGQWFHFLSSTAMPQHARPLHPMSGSGCAEGDACSLKHNLLWLCSVQLPQACSVSFQIRLALKCG